MKSYQANKDTLLFVDDRPCTLSSVLFMRDDINIILLRFNEVTLPEDYILETERFHSIYVNMNESILVGENTIENYIKKHFIKLDYFLNPSEPAQYYSQELAGKLGLNHLSKNVVHIVRNKAAMKKWLRNNSFKVANFRKVKSQPGLCSQVRKFAEENNWPVVIKPVDGWSTIDTTLLTQDNLESYKLPHNKQMLIEQYILGREYECCALISKGKVLETFVSYMPCAPLEIVEGGINANITLTKKEVNKEIPLDMTRLVQDMLNRLAVDHGYLHMEFFVQGNDIIIGEIGMRIAGCEIPANHGFAKGFDIYNTLINIHLNRDVELYCTQDICVGDLFLPVRAGRVKNISSEQSLLSKDYILKAKMNLEKGDEVEQLKASHVKSGFVHVHGNSRSDVESKMYAILDEFIYEVDDV